jgi:hypothetical protein
MSTKKSKGYGVGSASFLQLQAEIARQKEGLARNKAAGASVVKPNKVGRITILRTEVCRSGFFLKKPTVWGRQNKGVSERAARDVELEEVSRPTLESARAVLERKAKIYDQLRRGKTAGLSETQYDTLLVDVRIIVSTGFVFEFSYNYSLIPRL